MPEPRRDSTELVRRLRVPPYRPISLTEDRDPGARHGYASKAEAAGILERGIEELAELQDRLAAQDTFGLLVVLQGLDASGKDGAIKHVMSGLNPQGCRVESFKVPSAEELDHDYLWRYAKALPARGQIGIFNRSHYEEVLVVRVHRELLERQHLPHLHDRIWQHRYRDINAWERYLVENGFPIVKLFLHLSREEQRQRLLARIDRPTKNWKFSYADVSERERWDDYHRAYEEVLAHTSTEWAPWYVVPANHKWFARLAIAAVVVDALRAIDPQYPEIPDDQRAELVRARAVLDREG